MKLKIDRAKWLRGEGAYKSYLFRPEDGRMCCLGFLGLSYSLSPEDLTNVKMPTEIDKPGYPEWLGHREASDACKDITEVNDDPCISDQDREAKLTQLFALNDIQLEFVG